MEMMLSNNNNSIGNLGVNIKRQYNISEKVTQAVENRIKKINVSVENNISYWEEFAKTRTASSLPQYKSSIFRLLDSVNKDLATITPSEVELFTSQNKANKAYIKSILAYIYSNNIAGAKESLTKEMTVYLLPDEYKGLI